MLEVRAIRKTHLFTWIDRLQRDNDEQRFAFYVKIIRWSTELKRDNALKECKGIGRRTVRLDRKNSQLGLRGKTLVRNEISRSITEIP